MRTQEEILAKIKDVKPYDVFGVMQSDLIDYLEFCHAKQFLKDGVQEHDWEEYKGTDPAQEIYEYLPFAWSKANDCRGLSAFRSLMHFHAWLWLMGRDDLVEKFKSYEYYGKPQLVMLSKLVGFDHTEFSSSNWVNDECDDALSDEGKKELIKLWEGYAT